ncbi:hypothetical protein JX265_011165 [Neoarthrinium moseri]|uniref:DNA repair protein Rad26 n=1 Tax=Neoarthrinium moseri TaxID=1658444 RepID=A0A9P9WCI6_9PEZI|nr:hypothetical protein JX266_008026 [Neoarthrinium moseri]KAI1857430.1 hypothetical protein JX265_011165 [Neoarthrinium moseri]
MDDFSDDGFDDLNANVLDELENGAIQFTQAQKLADPTQASLKDEDYDDDDLDDAIVTDDLRGKSLLPSAAAADPYVTTSSRIVPQQLSQQNGWAATHAPASASQFRPQAITTTGRPPAQVTLRTRPSQPAGHAPMRPPPLPRPNTAVPSRYQASQAAPREGPSVEEFAALQAELLNLRQKVSHRDGEIDIVRKNMERHKREHEQELQALKKQSAELAAKSERAVEAAKFAQQTAATELEFTRRDLREELDRAKRKERDGGTPKKNPAAKAWGVSDGFEDVEMAGSPSRGNRGRNQGGVASVMPDPPARLTRTPTKGKRKRPMTVDSPVMALETTDDVVMADEGDSNAVSKSFNAALAPTPPPRRSFFDDFLKIILNHSSGKGRPLTFDYLAGFALPSKPTDSLASILFQKLAVIGDPSDSMRLPIEFCDRVIDLWLQCRKEGCLAPISELVSLVAFTLQLNTIAIAPHIAEALVAAAMDSLYEIGTPRLHNQSTTGDPADATFLNLKENIPTSAILSVLYLTALGCATTPPMRGTLSSSIVHFWNCVHPDFILMMIRNHNQPVDDFITTMHLLCTSSFEDSIGPISTTPNRTMDLVAPATIERLTFHLIETRQWNAGPEKGRSVCFAILRTLAAFARSPFGMNQLATHDYAIPRLVMFLSWSIDEMYDGNYASSSYVLPDLEPLSPKQSTPAEASLSSVAPSHPDELQTLIAQSMLLLHTIITNKDNRNSINVSNKLAKFTGGTQKYLLSLARLNFAEEGVSEETAELAHELLELAVTEEEGAELGDFFGG